MLESRKDDSKRSATDLPQISYGGPETCRQLYISCKTQKSGISNKNTKNICTNQIKSLPLQQICYVFCVIILTIKQNTY